MGTFAPAHAELASHVADKSIRLFAVIGIPRANGTALSIALTQSPSLGGLLNEAFSHPVPKLTRYDRPRLDSRSFDDGCGHILERVGMLSGSAPRAILLHDHAKDLSEPEFRALVPLVEHVVFVIRAPVKNTLSRFTRLLNELFSDDGGARISPQQALAAVKDKDAFERFSRERPDLIVPHKMATLSKAGGTEAARVVFIKVLESQLMVSWDNLARFVEIVRTEQPRDRWSLFDGDWLYADPARRFRTLAKRMNIEYTDAMLNDWTKGVGDDFKCIVSRRFGERAEDNAWNGPARSSRGIEEKSGSARAAPCDVRDFPAALQGVLQRLGKQYSALSELSDLAD